MRTVKLLLLPCVALATVADMKADFRLAAARANRGFTATATERSRLASLALELESAASLALELESAATSDGEQWAPTSSPLLPGRWFLDWCDAADVLSLSLSPAPAVIGDIYQEITVKEEGGFAALNAVELLPPGSGVISALFGVRGAGLYAVEAACAAISPTKLSLLFVGARLQPVAEPFALPAASATLPMPVIQWLQSLVGERVFLETTYLDDDFRIARGPQGELYVLSKRSD